MKYFLDTEFIERGSKYPVTLISLGIVAEDGREFYRISSEFRFRDASVWVKENVLAFLEEDLPRHTLDQIAKDVREFIGNDIPEFWGYYCDYDWVVFAQIFGTMMDLPSGWPMYCRDLKQVADQKGVGELPPVAGEHNALADAAWNRLVYRLLEEA